MAIKVKLLDLTKTRRKLERALTQDLRREVADLMVDAAEVVELDVQRAIDAPKSGRWYTRMKVKYQASAPGEAPAYATGTLYKTIRVTRSVGGFKPAARLRADGRYRHLEFGTSKMDARPAFIPAFNRNRKKVRDRVVKKSRDVMKRYRV